MKKILVNLKDWLNLNENIEYAKNVKDLDITLFPNMPYLSIYKDSGVKLGSQDVSAFSSGAHTGSVSIEHLLEFGIEAVLLNHKELKIKDDGILFDKIQNAIRANIEVILCIESVDAKELDRTKKILAKIDDTSKIVVAYEPTREMPLEKIKSDIDTLSTQLAPYKIESIIYGGSISKNNVETYNKELDVDGYLISRHALDVRELIEIVNLVK